MHEGIPEDVRDFLMEHVHTYQQLEALIVMQPDPLSDWTAESLGATLQLPADAAREALHQLWADLLLECTSTSPLKYRLSRADVRSTVQALAELYQKDRLAVMQQMNANAIERVRTGPVRDFANAFLIGDRKKRG
jgi:hypothetical protein